MSSTKKKPLTKGGRHQQSSTRKKKSASKNRRDHQQIPSTKRGSTFCSSSPLSHLYKPLSVLFNTTSFSSSSSSSSTGSKPPRSPRLLLVPPTSTTARPLLLEAESALLRCNSYAACIVEMASAAHRILLDPTADSLLLLLFFFQIHFTTETMRQHPNLLFHTKKLPYQTTSSQCRQLHKLSLISLITVLTDITPSYKLQQHDTTENDGAGGIFYFSTTSKKHDHSQLLSLPKTTGGGDNTTTTSTGGRSSTTTILSAKLQKQNLFEALLVNAIQNAIRLLLHFLTYTDNTHIGIQLLIKLLDSNQPDFLASHSLLFTLLKYTHFDSYTLNKKTPTTTTTTIPLVCNTPSLVCCFPDHAHRPCCRCAALQCVRGIIAQDVTWGHTASIVAMLQPEILSKPLLDILSGIPFQQRKREALREAAAVGAQDMKGIDKQTQRSFHMSCAHGSMSVIQSNEAVILKNLFVLYIRGLRQFDSSAGVVLGCLGGIRSYTHLVNVELAEELLRELKEVAECRSDPRVKARAIGCVIALSKEIVVPASKLPFGASNGRNGNVLQVDMNWILRALTDVVANSFLLLQSSDKSAEPSPEEPVAPCILTDCSISPASCSSRPGANADPFADIPELSRPTLLPSSFSITCSISTKSQNVFVEEVLRAVRLVLCSAQFGDSALSFGAVGTIPPAGAAGGASWEGLVVLMARLFAVALQAPPEVAHAIFLEVSFALMRFPRLSTLFDDEGVVLSSAEMLKCVDDGSKMVESRAKRADTRRCGLNNPRSDWQEGRLTASWMARLCRWHLVPQLGENVVQQIQPFQR